MAWAAQLGKPVLYVPGNHEFYGGSIAGTLNSSRHSAPARAVRVLDDEEVVIDGVRFLGSTLWTDFRLFGDGEQRTAAMAEALRFMRDYSRIFLDDALQQRFTPLDSAALFQRHAAWLAQRLAQPHDGPTVVITHHAPSPSSIHPRFAGSLLNACFVSGRRAPAGRQPGCSSGSTATRTTASTTSSTARGWCAIRAAMPSDGVNENAQFDPDFIAAVA